jgi:hypothetical protein
MEPTLQGETVQSLDWIDKEIKTAMEKMLPTASTQNYLQTYGKYQEWRASKGLKGPTNEKELFAYLYHKLESGKWVSPGTLWSKFSMLRTTIMSQESIDIKGTSMNSTIQTWLKRVGNEHKLKQAHMFTKEEVHRFLIEAPKNMVDHKMILLIGVYTGLRCETLTLLEWRHIKITEGKVEVFIDYQSKTDQAANGTWFSLPSAPNDARIDPASLLHEYRRLLESKSKALATGRLWLRIDQAANGTCVVCRQVRGKEWISSVPKKVAVWLGLAEAEKYTGHSFRRTCAQWAADAGTTDTMMQHHFGWKSQSMVTRYSRSSKKLKESMAASLSIENEGPSKASEIGGEKRKRQNDGNSNDNDKQPRSTYHEVSKAAPASPEPLLESEVGIRCYALDAKKNGKSGFQNAEKTAKIDLDGVFSGCTISGSNVMVNIYNGPGPCASPQVVF